MRAYGETFKRFTQCLKWAKEGKTFIYVDLDFVAIDQKSWKKIERILKPPLPIIEAMYDEYSEWTPETSKLLEEILDKRLK